MSEADNHHEKIADPTAVIGHSDFVESLASSMVNGRMHHAWLLTGPSGIGKATVARLAAAWLLSERVNTRDLFGAEVAGFSVSLDDPGAKLVFNGAHPDYLAIAPVLDDNKSGQIKIDQIRAMVPFMAHKPALGRFRVTLIDSMDEVNRNGANAMLKLLEEPPENSVIFLVSSRPGQLPLTIRSRCRVVRLSPLDAPSCRDVLTKKWPDADTKQVDLLAHLCAGAPGRAISLAESGASDCYQAACSLLAEPKLNVSAMATLTGKWGRGAAAGRISREGAVFCLDRLLQLAALKASGRNAFVPCDFEVPAIRVLCGRHSSTQLAAFHGEFLRESMRAEGLYLDFSQFLLQQMIKLCEKTLP
jgi:DNA polymerase-3 subunit delta'